jgi:hypothetical protein
MPITFTEIQCHPASLSISDDDICSTCENLAYCPGESSVCNLSLNGDAGDWPCSFDEDNYVVNCGEHIPLMFDEQNWIKP